MGGKDPCRRCLRRYKEAIVRSLAWSPSGKGVRDDDMDSERGVVTCYSCRQTTMLEDERLVLPKSVGHVAVVLKIFFFHLLMSHHFPIISGSARNLLIPVSYLR